MKLTKALIGKRRAIAEDVIAQIKRGRFEARSGIYIGLDDDNALRAHVGKELQKILPKVVTKTKPCQVCAIGSVFLSSVCKFDKFKLIYASLDEYDNISSSSMRGKVNEFFTRSEQDAMESSFEVGFEDTYPNYYAFLDSIDDEQRLLWLMGAVVIVANEPITVEALRRQALITIAKSGDISLYI